MSLISVLQSLNGAKCLNATYVASRSGSLFLTGSLPATAIVLVTVIFPVTKTYASE